MSESDAFTGYLLFVSNNKKYMDVTFKIHNIHCPVHYNIKGYLSTIVISLKIK